MKKLLALLLTLALTLSLATPALADMGYAPLNTDPEWLAWKEEWIATHPEEYAAFDADAWFAEHYEWYDTKEFFMEYGGITTEEEFFDHMAETWLGQVQYAEKEAQRLADFQAEHPEEYADFDADAYFAREYSWYSKEEYMSLYGLTDEAGFREEMLLAYLWDRDIQTQRQDRIAAYLAEHPTALDDFDPDALLRSYGYQSPKSAFMLDYGLTSDEEFIAYLQDDYITMLETYDGYRAEIAAYEAEHPGATAAFDADAYFQQEYGAYYSTKEEFIDDVLPSDSEEVYRTYLLWLWVISQTSQGGLDWSEGYYDAEKEALGGIPGELSIMADGTYLQFEEGEKPYALAGITYAPADALTQVLGETSTEVGADGYVPLRDAAAAAGYRVYWDSDLETAVLLSPANVAATMDEEFTILNGAMEQWNLDPAKTYQTDCTIAIDTTVLNSIDGDKTYSAAIVLDQLSAATGEEVSGTYDFSEFETLLTDVLGANTMASYFYDMEELDAIMDLLRAGDFQIRIDYTTGMVYFSGSFLPSLFSLLDTPYSKGTWLSMGVEGMTDAALIPSTVGSYVTAIFMASCENSYYLTPAYYHQEIVTAGTTVVGLLGDDSFQQQGSDYVLNLDVEALASKYGLDDGNSAFRELAFTLTVKKDGTITGNFALRPAADYSFLVDMRMTGDWSLTAEERTLNLDLHLKNFFQMTFSVHAQTTPTTDQPQTTPPSGAIILPMDEPKSILLPVATVY